MENKANLDTVGFGCRRSHWALVMAMLMPIGWCSLASADFTKLAQRLPADTDAVIAVNVAKLMDTPYAKREKWADLTADAWAVRPLMIPPGSTRLLMGAGMKPSEMESAWELCLMEMQTMPSLEALARAEGGYIDRVWDKNAVCSPVNAYFVPLDAKTLASITPAERQVIARWVRQPVKPEGNLKSEYIQKVVASLGDATDMVMALDLEGAVAVPVIRKRLEEAQIKEFKGQNLDAIARTLGSIKGVRLDVGVGEKLTGRAVVHFGQDASHLQVGVKPLVAAVLRRNGMWIDDIENWIFRASGGEVTFQGELSTPGLRALMSLVQSPIPAATAAAAAPAGAGAAAAKPLDPAQASLRYYKSVCAVIDGLREGNSVSETSVFLKRAAKRIEQLPILNVDPQLVEWGGLVTLKLKQAAGVATVTQTQINSRVAGVKSTEYGSYTFDDGGNYDSWAWAETEAVAQQSRQAAQEQKAQGQQDAQRLIGEIGGSRAKVRAAMVEKYQIEF